MRISESVQSLTHLQTWEDLKNWVKENSKILIKLDQYSGIEGDPKKGAYGLVWKIKGQNLVLKVTTDQMEMEIAKKITGKNTQGFAKILFSEIITEKEHKGSKIPPVMVRIQELCYDDPELDSTWVDRLLADILEEGKDKEELIDLYRHPLTLEIIELIEKVDQDLNKVGSVAEAGNLDIYRKNIMRDIKGKLKVVDF
jgi:hypothetical protein